MCGLATWKGAAATSPVDLGRFAPCVRCWPYAIDGKVAMEVGRNGRASKGVQDYAIDLGHDGKVCKILASGAAREDGRKGGVKHGVVCTVEVKEWLEARGRKLGQATRG